MFTIIIKNAATIQDRSSMTSRLTLRSITEDADTALVQTLVESRERWRTLVAESASFVFETDEAGRLVLLAPDLVLGWPAARLIGEPAASLLFHVGEASAEAPFGASAETPFRTSAEAPFGEAAEAPFGGPAEAPFNPFETKQAVRGRRVWLRDASGMPVCMLVCAAPIAGKAGAVRGLGIDVTEQEQRDAARAASLAQHEAARALAFRMRDAALPFASLTAGLEELVRMIDGDGASVLLHEPARPLRVAAKAGRSWPGIPQALHDDVIAACRPPPTWLAETSYKSEACGQSLLICTGANHFVDRAVLAVWRDGAAWNAAEVAIAEALLQAIQPILEHEQIQRETARLSRTDFLTGLFNRQGFVSELSRRLDRLDREGHPAALLVVGLDKLASVNAGFGVEGGDQALEQAAVLLRNGVRPTDLVARMGGDLFGLWLDNADQFTAAERADHLVRAGIEIDQETTRITLSVGIAIRTSRSFESIDSLLYRASGAMQASKRAGGGRWLVSTGEPSP